MKLHKKRKAGPVNIMWWVISGTSQRGHRPLPGPWRFATSTEVGRRSRSNCHTNILVLRGSGAFHNGDVHARTGPLHRARYADLTVKIPEGDRCHETLSEEAEREPGSDKGIVNRAR
jgi:hypothetical protein